MNWFWMNVPLDAIFFAAWAGIPLWLVFRHPDTGPGQRAANLEIEVEASVALDAEPAYAVAAAGATGN